MNDENTKVADEKAGNNFNRQVKNNQLKFEGDDFMFQLTDAEIAQLSRCKNFTLTEEVVVEKM